MPPQRNHTLSVKVTAEERNAFHSAAKRQGISASDWLRQQGMNGILAPAPAEPKRIAVPVLIPATESALNDGVPEAMCISSSSNEVAKMHKPTAIAPSEPDTAPPTPTVPPINGVPKAVPAEQRMYEIISKRSGSVAADAWRKSRAIKTPEKIVEATVEVAVPPHLNLFYQNMVRTQGKPSADLWLLCQTSGKKISL